MTSDKLLPCPFCGDEKPNLTHDDYVHDDLRPMPVVECTKCHTWVRAEAWNKRVSPLSALGRAQNKIEKLQDELTRRRVTSVEMDGRTLPVVDWNELSRRGVLVRVNEMLRAEGLAVMRVVETGKSPGAMVLEVDNSLRVGAPDLATAQDIIDRADRELAEVGAAIGTDAYLDLPDGGSVSLGEQVRRMREEFVGLLQRVYDADQSDRFQSVAELMDDIETVLQRHQQ